MKPKIIPKACLVHLLREMANRIEIDDSWEGSVEYSCLQEGCTDGNFSVMAAYRVNNLNGQGGMQLLGDPDDPAPAPEAAPPEEPTI